MIFKKTMMLLSLCFSFCMVQASDDRKRCKEIALQALQLITEMQRNNAAGIEEMIVMHNDLTQVLRSMQPQVENIVAIQQTENNNDNGMAVLNARFEELRSMQFHTVATKQTKNNNDLDR